MKKIKVYSTFLENGGGTTGYINVCKEDFVNDQFDDPTKMIPRPSFYVKVRETLGITWGPQHVWHFVDQDQIDYEIKRLIKIINKKKALLKQLLCTSETGTEKIL